MDFSQVLNKNTNIIIEQWIVAVREDRQIESSDDLSYTAIKDHIPDICKAMITVLSTSQNSDIQSIVAASWEHGLLRAEQGFDPTEIAREYRLLRSIIFNSLETSLLQGSPAEIIRSMRLIDAVIDEAIARCFHSYVQERLQDLQSLYSALTLHNEELTRLINANQEHISQLAHDLKQPLTSIIGYSDLFLRQQGSKCGLKDKSANLEHIERVLRNGRYSLRLINDLLELSQYDNGEIKIKPGLTNISELISKVREMLELSAIQKKLTLVVDNQLTHTEIIIDAFKLQQIMINLVSNAVRYTESGMINIVYRDLDDQNWAIAVSDTGIGITPEDQARIFEPYFRVSSSDHSYHCDSTGLGLAIVLRLVKLLQGEINLVSQLGVGSTFTVILPLQMQS